jgi:hypothetical protein
MGLIVPEYITEQLKVNSKELIDISTGEVFDVENSNVFKSTITSKSKIKYSNFVFLDSNQTILLLKKGLSQNDLGLLMILSSQIEMETNICVQESEYPHNTVSISKLIGCSQQATKRKLNNLIEFGALYYGPVGKNIKKVYVLNPHIIKKGVTTRKIIVDKFKEIYKESNLKNVFGE